MSCWNIASCELSKSFHHNLPCEVDHPKSQLSRAYSVIPLVVRQRIPFVNSVRYSNRQDSSPATKKSQSQLIHEGSANIDRCDHHTCTIPSSTAPSASLLSLSPDPDMAALVSSSRNSQPPSPACDTMPGGVDWDRVCLGLQIGQTAMNQLRSNTRPTTVRGMYLDAVRYMLMSLPSDLTENEVCSLHESLPEAVRMDEDGVAVRADGNNFLRKITAQTVYGIIAMVFFLLPILMSIFSRMLKYERQHQLTERVVVSCGNVLQHLYSKDSNFSDILFRLKTSAVGTFLGGIVVWIVHSVAAGVNDGLSASSSGAPRSLRDSR